MMLMTTIFMEIKKLRIFSWSKGDLTEIFSWYDSHKKYIKLHNNTRSIVEEILGLIKDKLEENTYAENQ